MWPLWLISRTFQTVSCWDWEEEDKSLLSGEAWTQPKVRRLHLLHQPAGISQGLLGETPKNLNLFDGNFVPVWRLWAPCRLERRHEPSWAEQSNAQPGRALSWDGPNQTELTLIEMSHKELNETEWSLLSQTKVSRAQLSQSESSDPTEPNWAKKEQNWTVKSSQAKSNQIELNRAKYNWPKFSWFESSGTELS